MGISYINRYVFLAVCQAQHTEQHTLSHVHSLCGNPLVHILCPEISLCLSRTPLTHSLIDHCWWNSLRLSAGSSAGSHNHQPLWDRLCWACSTSDEWCRRCQNCSIPVPLLHMPYGAAYTSFGQIFYRTEFRGIVTFWDILIILPQ